MGGRFVGVDIPQGATIESAYFNIRARSSDSSTGVKSKLRGEDSDNAVTFTDYDNYSARPRTSAVVYWDDIPPWTAGVVYTSPNIKTIIQEIVDRPNWVAGNDLVIFWDDHDGRSDDGTHLRRGCSFEHSSGVSPQLEVTWNITGPEPGEDYTVNLTESTSLYDIGSPLNRTPYNLYLQEVEALTYIKKTNTTLKAKFKQRYRW